MKVEREGKMVRGVRVLLPSEQSVCVSHINEVTSKVESQNIEIISAVSEPRQHLGKY